jgi:GAF domain-containing protein
MGPRPRERHLLSAQELSVSASFDLVTVLTRATEQINAQEDLRQVLADLAHSARASTPGDNHVGISLSHRDGTVETLAATDPLVHRLDQRQYELGEGPCLSAIWEEGLVVVNDARTEGRWPSFMRYAVDQGLRAQMGMRIYVEDKTVGGLNLYSTEHETIEPEVEQVMRLFASLAAVAMGKAATVENLNAALVTRKRIGQAVGILMERYELDEDRAFQYLARLSQTRNTKLRDIADELVEAAIRRNGLPRSRPFEQGITAPTT